MIKIFACGDIVNKDGEDTIVDNNLKTIIKECDISICNFEAPINTNSQPIKKAGPHLSQEKNSIKVLKELDFNLLSLANNHIYDYGELGLHETIKEIEKNNLEFVGSNLNYEDTYKPKIINIKDTKIGFIAACEAEFGCMIDSSFSSGYAWINSNKIDKTILSLKNEVDIVIILSHAGVELSNVPLPEWRDRYKYLCDLGADLIIGHHPHVPQGYEEYNNSYIFYSLGNFHFNNNTEKSYIDDSYSVIFTIENKKIQCYEILYHKLVNNITTLVDKENVNFNLKELNKNLYDNYDISINNLVINYYENFFHKYYKHALNNTVDTMAQDQGLLLLHNLRIDSHRFLVQRALRLKYEV